MKNTKVTQERKQFRTTIPKKLMEESGNEKGSVTSWSLKNGKLKAQVLTHEEFMEKVREASREPTLREKTNDVFSEDKFGSRKNGL